MSQDNPAGMDALTGLLHTCMSEAAGLPESTGVFVRNYDDWSE
jgi:hypothetical protein